MTIFLEKYALPILATLSAALIVLLINPMHFAGPQKSLILVVFVALAGVAGWEITRRNAKRVAPIELPPSITDGKDGRIFVPLKPGELMDTYYGRTEIQASKLAASYMGKWLAVSGKVCEVFNFHDFVTVVLLEDRPTSRLTHIELCFSKELWAQHLEILPLNHHITAIGQIKRIDWNTIRLMDCELVETARK